MDKVNNVMEDLIKNHLPDYLELKEDKYRATEKFKQHHKTMGYISFKLRDWAAPGPQRTLIETYPQNTQEKKSINKPNT